MKVYKTKKHTASKHTLDGISSHYHCTCIHRPCCLCLMFMLLIVKFHEYKFSSTWAVKGPDGTVNGEVERVLKEFHSNKKPIA